MELLLKENLVRMGGIRFFIKRSISIQGAIKARNRGWNPA